VNVANLIAFCGYSLVTLTWLVFGITYLRASKIMPYHLEAMGSSWEALSSGMRTMSVDFMKSAATGFITSAIAVIFLLIFAFRLNLRWSVWALGAISLFELTTILLIMNHVKRNTKAKVPMQLQIGLSVIAACAFICSLIGTYLL
jgi:hypothetical protein